MTINKILKLGILTFSLVVGFAVRGEVVSPTVSCSFNDLGVQTGGTVSLPVIVENNFALSGWQCDITVPEGVTVTDISLNPSRTSDHTGNFSVYTDHSYRYVVASMAFQGTTGETGPLFYVKLKVVSNPGEYDITLSNFRCTDTDSENTHEYVAAPYTGKLTVVEADAGPFDLVDGTPYVNSINYNNVDVTYTRNFKNTSWQPLYVPFDMTYEEWSEYVDVAELYNVRGYDTDSDGEIDDVYLEFNSLKDGSKIKPNVPYMIKAKEVGEVTFDCKNKTLLACPDEEGWVQCSSTKYNYTLYGIYETKTDLIQDGLYYMAGGSFYYTDNPNLKILPYRAYLMVCTKSDGYNEVGIDQALMKICLSVDGQDTTLIENVFYETLFKDKIYDLMGREVKNPEKGIYIKNGSKIYINK